MPDDNDLKCMICEAFSGPQGAECPNCGIIIDEGYCPEADECGDDE